MSDGDGEWVWVVYDGARDYQVVAAFTKQVDALDFLDTVLRSSMSLYRVPFNPPAATAAQVAGDDE